MAAITKKMTTIDYCHLFYYIPGITFFILFCSYHQQVPSEIPRLELKASHGLANPEEFQLPSPHADWREAYKGFDVSEVLLDKIKKGEEVRLTVSTKDV